MTAKPEVSNRDMLVMSVLIMTGTESDAYFDPLKHGYLQRDDPVYRMPPIV
ncbi:hypothetical protein [Nitrosomonas marina]|uniref:hypothetical protein n=1 Tax=Nitrosomonas marina TaxID=917 RepID=UPI0015A60836|nr:hypothetical protein [Nitrosomonas marina]